MIAPPAEVRRIAYLGTPALAIAPLVALHEAGYDIPLVVSQPDAKRGRGGALTPSPVKRVATELGLTVSSNVDDLLEIDVDLAVVVAFGQIIRPHVLEQVPMVNMHFSLLPRWRGAAPVERALLAGDAVTGVCLMVLEEALDTGPVYCRTEVPIDDDATLDSLRTALVQEGTRLLVEALDQGLESPIPQEGEVSWAKKIKPDELRLDWSRPASELHRVVRLGNAWTTVDGRRLKVWAASVGSHGDLSRGQVDGVQVGTGDGALELIEVQAEGKPRRLASDWANGVRLGPDARLGE